MQIKGVKIDTGMLSASKIPTMKKNASYNLESIDDAMQSKKSGSTMNGGFGADDNFDNQILRKDSKSFSSDNLDELVIWHEGAPKPEEFDLTKIQNVNDNSKITIERNDSDLDVRTVNIDTASGKMGTITFVDNQEAAIKSLATLSNFTISAIGGVGKVIEGVLDTGIMAIGTAESAIASIFDPSYANSLQETTRSLVEHDAMGNLADKIADVTGISQISNDYDNVKNAGFAIGNMLTKTAAMLFSGGAAVPIIGLSDAGNNIETQWASGSSYGDGLISGGVSGVFSAVGWALGGKSVEIIQFEDALLNAVLRAEMNGFLGGINSTEDTVTSILQRYYNRDDVDGKSLLDVLSEEALENNTIASFAGGMFTAMGLSALGDVAGLPKLYKEKQIKGVKNEILDLSSKLNGNNESNKLADVIGEQLFKLHDARNIEKIKLTRKAAFEILTEDGYTDEAAASLLTNLESDALKRIGYDSYIDEVSGLRVNILKGLNIRNIKYNSDDIIKHVMNLPEELQGYVSEINIYDTLDPWDNYWMYESKDLTHIAVASTDGSGVVDFWKFYDGGLSTVVHEIGHGYDKNPKLLSLWEDVIGSTDSEHKISDSKGWREAMDADLRQYGKRGVTSYATENEAEDFAETVATYYTKPRKLDKFPNRKALVENIRSFYESSTQGNQ